MTDEKPVVTFASLRDGHACGTGNQRKKMFFSVMEDGQIVCIIAEPHPEDAPLTGSVGDVRRTPVGQPLRWRILEYIHMSREDFNVWLRGTRQWWDEEKRHPSVPSTYRR